MKKNLLTKVTNKNAFVFLFIIIFVGITVGQSDPAVSSNQSPRVTAIEIIERAENLIGENVKIKDFKKMSIEFSTVRFNSKGQYNVETKLFLSFPNEFRREDYSDFTTNQQLLTQILNLNQYSQTSDLFTNGQPFNPILNMKGVLPKMTKEQQTASFRHSVFSTIFPLILQSSWYQNLDFKFVGNAESEDGKAEVIEAVDKNNIKFQLFFNKQNHLPVMMIESWVSTVENKEFERKSYFSDYREESGLRIAHKIVVQLGSKIVEERQLKKLQINPSFKANLFEVDKTKRNVFDN